MIDPAALFTPEFHRNPYPAYAEIRREGALVQLGELGAWIATGHDLVREVFRRPDIRSGMSQEYLDTGGAAERWQERAPTTWVFFVNNLLAKNPPEHTRLRGLVSKAFTPSVVRGLRPEVERYVDGLLDALEPRGDMELLSEFAYPLPLNVIARLLGVPDDAHEQLKRWSQPLAQILDGMTRAHMLEVAEQAAVEMNAFMRDQFEQHRARPGDDLIDRLLLAHDEGDRLSDDELLSICTLILVAGHETTTNLLGNGVLALLRNRDQWERLCADPALVPGAVEELLRYDSPVQFTARRTVGEVEIAGTRVPDDQEILLVLGAANRDPAHFADPDRLDIARDPVDHVSFALGGHFCLGANLARMEAQVALEALTRRLPGLRLAGDPDALEYRAGFAIRALEKLPVCW